MLAVETDLRPLNHMTRDDAVTYDLKSDHSSRRSIYVLAFYNSIAGLQANLICWVAGDDVSYYVVHVTVYAVVDTYTAVVVLAVPLTVRPRTSDFCTHCLIYSWLGLLLN